MQSESRIQVLPEFIANQIAAGEVVQRPESVVKELVENSLDAGSTHVTVVVRQAGKSLIHIVDNGSGMSRDDLSLALKRHATSKIRSVEDLQHIMTLGFRGEALASIASVAQVEILTRVAQVEILTRRQEEAHGWKLVSEPLRDATIEAAQQESGTQILVRNLFFAVPARRKFLRSDVTEFRHISDTMIRFALSHPDIRFTFHDGDSLIFDVRPQSQQERIRDLLGDKTYQAVVPLLLKTDDVEISGFLGKPSLARSTRSSQYLFLNKRAIANRALSHAVYQAFEHLLDSSQHPMYVMNIEINAERVDVNVHPQKSEVKFDNEKMMYDMVHEAVLQALRTNSMIPDVHFGLGSSQTPFEKLSYGPTPALPSDSDVVLVNKITGEIVTNTPSYQAPARSVGSVSSGPRFGSEQSSSAPPPQQSWTKQWGSQYQSAFDALFSDPTATQQATGEASSAAGADLPEKMLWQLHNKYIFMQSPEGVVIIDQHIAHERILYEKALDAMNRELSRAQKLLFPVHMQLSVVEKSIIDEVGDDIRAMGYEFTIKDNDLELHGVPLDIKNGKEASSLQEVMEQFSEYQQVRPASVRDNLAASFGCRAAIKAGDPLTYPHMRQLIEDLFKCQTPEVCPHGRPVLIRLELKELDRRFGRTS